MSKDEFSITKMLIQVTFGFIIYGAIFFIPAGSLEWLEAWVFLIISFLYVLVVVFYFWKRDPSILVSRSKVKPEKGFDMIFFLLAGLAFLAMFLLSAMDFRSGISATVFPGIKALGFILVVATYLIVFFVMRENSYASKSIRVEEDQKVISSGPYAYVRHPMYSGFILMYLGFPLAFGSLISLPFAIFSIILLAVRSYYEEKALIKDLPGYEEYTKRVKYRLIPKIW